MPHSLLLRVYSAQHHIHHCTLKAFGQFEALSLSRSRAQWVIGVGHIFHEHILTLNCLIKSCHMSLFKRNKWIWHTLIAIFSLYVVVCRVLNDGMITLLGTHWLLFYLLDVVVCRVLNDGVITLFGTHWLLFYLLYVVVCRVMNDGVITLFGTHWLLFFHFML